MCYCVDIYKVFWIFLSALKLELLFLVSSLKAFLNESGLIIVMMCCESITGVNGELGCVLMILSNRCFSTQVSLCL